MYEPAIGDPMESETASSTLDVIGGGLADGVGAMAIRGSQLNCDAGILR
jgi:hypothetical protein